MESHWTKDGALRNNNIDINSCENFPCRTTLSLLLLKNEKNIPQNLTLNSIRLEFMKQTNLPDPGKSLEYI